MISEVIKDDAGETATQIQQLCLSKQQQAEELIMQKKSGIMGSLLVRTCRFECHILTQMESKKVKKKYPSFDRVVIEAKQPKDWFTNNGDMARLVLTYDKRLIFVYMKDMSYAIKWQRYLVIERLLQCHSELVASCMERTQVEYQQRFQHTWAVAFQRAIEQYTTTLNRNKRMSAKIDTAFIDQMEKAILNYHIVKWKNRTNKAYREEQAELDVQRKLSLEQQEQMRLKREADAKRLQEKQHRREELIAKACSRLSTKKQTIQNFYLMWKNRSTYIINNVPGDFKLTFLSLLVSESDSVLMRPELKIQLISEREKYTEDFLNEKEVGAYKYKAKGCYFSQKLLGQLAQQIRRGFTNWNFKDGVLGLCGKRVLEVKPMGFKDYLDITLIDSLQVNQQQSTLRVQVQDLYVHTNGGRLSWLPMQYQNSRVYLKILIGEDSDMDPLYLDYLQFVQLNPQLIKVTLKVIEESTLQPIVECVKFALEQAKYAQELQALYQDYYIQNICLQPAVDASIWFAALDGINVLVLPIVDVLKRNYLEFITGEDPVVIYEQLKNIDKKKELRLPLLKDVVEFVTKSPHRFIKITECLNAILTTYMIYCNLKGIQLNVSYLPTLFKIAQKFVILNHYHFFAKRNPPVFGSQYQIEAQSFWLFVIFTTLMKQLRLPLYKSEDLYMPQEVIMLYLEALHKPLVEHCKINQVAVENIFFELIQNMFTNLCESQPLFNIWNLIIKSQNENIIQLIIIILLEELGDKLLLCNTTEDFFAALRIQSHLMDSRTMTTKLPVCESNLQRIIKAAVIVPETLNHSQVHSKIT